MDTQTAGIKALDWAVANKDRVEQQLQRQGAVLVRGLNIPSSKLLGKVLCTLFGGDLLEYMYRSTPRTAVKNNVYTATEYASDQVIAQHNEMAYSNSWPLRIGFYCLLPSSAGGQTPIADSRQIYQAIPKAIRDEFEAKKIRYIRNYSELDLPWQEVFCTQNKQQVEHYCQQNQLSCEWFADNRLRTSQVNLAVQQHPFSQQKVWFNQAHLFHRSNLPDEVASALLNSVGKDNLPRHAEFGDGSEIDSAYLTIIRAVIDSHKISFDWQKQDLMLLDNMLFSHGRAPFEGQRKVLVGMARAHN